jgi:hypothetical protein
MRYTKSVLIHYLAALLQASNSIFPNKYGENPAPFSGTAFVLHDSILGGEFMLETLIIVLLVLWLLGIVTGTAGQFIHFLLAVAFLIFVVRLFSGRRAF